MNLQMNEQTQEIITKDIIANIYDVTLNRIPSDEEIKQVLKIAATEGLTKRALFISLLCSSEFVISLSDDAIKFHSNFIHNTRIKLISNFLPAANVILDIGGANGSLVEYGYKQDYEKLIITDLPSEERIESLKDVNLFDKWGHNPKIEVIYTTMSDLKQLQDGSVDLVWVGQVVEHIEENDLIIAFSEIKRVLKPEGFFCFDTPNGIMSRIHSPDKLLHPEHKKEYTPAEMRNLLAPYFEIKQELGLVPMPISYKSGQFSYHEMVMNNTLSDNLDHSYLMYFKCQPHN